MKNIHNFLFIFLALIIVECSSLSARSWKVLKIDSVSILNDICFPWDTKTGFVVGKKVSLINHHDRYESIFKTTDGGETFTTIPFPNPPGNLKVNFYNINFFKETNQVLLTGDVKYYGFVGIYSADTFSTWRYYYYYLWNGEPLINYSFMKASFPENMQTGYFCISANNYNDGREEAFLKFVGSNDSSKQSTYFYRQNYQWAPDVPDFRNVCFFDNKLGFLLTENGIQKTTDGGETLINSYKTEFGNYYRDIKYLDKNDPSTWVAVGGNIVKSTDTGATWVVCPILGGDFLKISDDKKLCITGFDNHILTSTDEGNTWSVVYDYLEDKFDNFTGAYIPPNQSDVIYVISERGVILKGENMTDVEDPAKPESIQEIVPNPVTDFLSIPRYNENENIKIYSIEGILVYQTSNVLKTLDVSTKIDVSTFAPGIYYVMVRDRVCRFIKI